MGHPEKCSRYPGLLAGGHLASMVATSSSVAGPKGGHAPSRPDFQILLYPVISLRETANAHTGSRRHLLGPAPGEVRLAAYSSDELVSAHTPPAFLVHAADDTGVPIANSRNYQAALQKAGVPCELLELSSGGHAFGLGVHGGEPLKWPPLCLEWLKLQGFAA
jgi:acetyl esterase/lipase